MDYYEDEFENYINIQVSIENSSPIFIATLNYDEEETYLFTAKNTFDTLKGIINVRERVLKCKDLNVESILTSEINTPEYNYGRTYPIDKVCIKNNIILLTALENLKMLGLDIHYHIEEFLSDGSNQTVFFVEFNGYSFEGQANTRENNRYRVKTEKFTFLEEQTLIGLIDHMASISKIDINDDIIRCVEEAEKTPIVDIKEEKIESLDIEFYRGLFRTFNAIESLEQLYSYGSICTGDCECCELHECHDEVFPDEYLLNEGANMILTYGKV